jgi:hypothetical protein
MASGVAGGSPGAPEVDMMEATVRQRSGWEKATCWATIPPREMPATWACSTRSASSTPTVSRAMSASV